MPKIESASNSSVLTNEVPIKVELFKHSDLDKHWCEFKKKFNKTYSDCTIEQQKYTNFYNYKAK